MIKTEITEFSEKWIDANDSGGLISIWECPVCQHKDSDTGGGEFFITNYEAQPCKKCGTKFIFEYNIKVFKIEEE